ncbi:MAG TPA: 4-hydroxy-tetrahydrodipicolinate reductase [Bacteroidota bacterium]|nr:4-hydroxy-tetrahydrodipicolinate reductase [Bacteroidota bacterium]
MNIALIGYGKMGKEIERLAPERGMTVKKIFPTDREIGAINRTSLRGIDVCIDFTSPAATLEIVTRVAGSGKNLVTGTTGWYDQLGRISAVVRKNKTGFLYSPNFSVGMNAFFRIVAGAAKALEPFGEYDAAVHEIHHREKKDSPSGTALMLGRLLLNERKSKKELLTGHPDGAIEPSQLQITSQRLGRVVGVHSVTFDSGADTIELIHRAKDRSGFALGALVAAGWLSKKRGIFTMDNVLDTL